MDVKNYDTKIRAFPLWSALPDALWQSLADNLKILQYAADDTVFPNEDTAHDLCVLWGGQANVYAALPSSLPDRSEHPPLLRTMDGGAVFGVHAVFNREMQPQSLIIATKPCTVLAIPAKIWESILFSHPQTMASYVRFLEQRIQFLNRKIRYLTAGSAERRLALFLLTEIPQENVPVRLDMSAVCMADLLDLGRASLYRAMTQLTKDGFLIRHGHEYRLLRRAELANFYQ